MSVIEKLIKAEEKRQFSKVNLIASENLVSEAVMRAAGSCLTNKYAEGYPGARYYGGCEVVDQVENHAINMAKQVFGAEHANVQPHCGSAANMAVYMAMLQPGDTILTLDFSAGGHLTHGAKVNFSGKLYNVVSYGLAEDGVLDYAGMEKLAKQHKPKLIQAGSTAYSLIPDIERIAKIAKDNNALFMFDMAHVAGLVAAGLHPNPCEHADFVTSTTHKTLRGPRGGLILCKKEHAAAVDKCIMPGIQGGPLMHIIAAKAVCFEETQHPSFKKYQQDVIDNAKYLCEGLMEAGLKVVSNGTQTHLFSIDLIASESKKSGKQVEDELNEKYNIVVNRNMVPGDTRGPLHASGIRIGLPFISNFKKVDKNALDELRDILVAVVKDTPAPEVKLLRKIFK